MFERYTEKARRVIFFARYEASEFGSREIRPIHLLLGILREGNETISPLLRSGDTIESIRSELIKAHPAPAERLATSVDLPLSRDAKQALAAAAEESDRQNQRSIELVHLLLALLREPTLSEFLHAHGINRESLLAHIVLSTHPETGEDPRGRLLSLIKDLPSDLCEEAEEALRAVLSASRATATRRIHVDNGAATVETTRTFRGQEIVVTETVQSGSEPGALDYSVTVQALGEARVWRTTFKPSSLET